MAAHTLRLKLKVNSEISYNLEKRFNCVNRCHNILVRRSIQLLHKLDHSQRYQFIKKAFFSLALRISYVLPRITFSLRLLKK